MIILIRKRSFYFLFALIWICNLYSCDTVDTVKPNPSKDSASVQTDELFKKYKLDKITLPAGFSINVYAKAEGARSLCVSSAGTLFVGTQGAGKVYAIKDENHDGKADKVYTVAKVLKTPNGVALTDGNLYIATISTI